MQLFVQLFVVQKSKFSHILMTQKEYHKVYINIKNIHM